MKRNRLFRSAVLTTALLAFGLTVWLSDANAISRYTSTSMTCAAIKSKVRAERAVILRWPSSQDPRRTIYDRFVANEAYCGFGETTRSKLIPAAGGKKCWVWRCTRERFFDDRFFGGGFGGFK